MTTVNPAALNCALETGETVKQYLLRLFLEFWTEKERFNPKRPFGDSDWDYTIYAALISGGFIPGSLDDDGYVAELDTQAASEYVESLIRLIWDSPR